MEVLPEYTRHLRPFSSEVKLSGLPPQDLDTQKFHLLNVVLFFN